MLALCSSSQGSHFGGGPSHFSAACSEMLAEAWPCPCHRLGVTVSLTQRQKELKQSARGHSTPRPGFRLLGNCSKTKNHGSHSQPGGA